jgi:hypothetical protein
MQRDGLCIVQGQTATAENICAAQQSGSEPGAAECSVGAPGEGPLPEGKRRRAKADAAGSNAKRPRRVAGRAGALINRWHNVAKTLEEEEVRAADEPPLSLLGGVSAA